MEAESQNYSFPACRHTFYEKYVKRILDFILSSLALVILSPLYLIIAILVKVKLGSPIFFKQVRIGKDEKPFTMVKFRSMRDGKDKNGTFLPDNERLTRFGRILRATSLDELPEIWNIVKGDMAIIGPRPLPEVYLPYYKQEERLRHAIRGGLTGLAQVKGRNSIGWDSKFAIDVEYVQKVSFRMDLYIFFKTIINVLKRSDIGERGVSSPDDLDFIRQKQAWYLNTHK